MKCWLYEILKEKCRSYENWLRFIEFHKKDIRFESIDDGEIKFYIPNVSLKIDKERKIHRITDIR